MSELPGRIAVINVGWSDDYQGADVLGQHGYILEGNEGHERFNLLPAPDGQYYLYVPPIGGHHPSPSDGDDWLVFMVSRRPKRPGLVVVAWFENARFDTGWPSRPDWRELKKKTGVEYHYSIVAPGAFIVPAPVRDFTFHGDHVKRPYAYLRGWKREAWREHLAEDLLAYRASMLEAAASDASNDLTRATGGFCVDPKRRKRVEEAAVNAVRRHFGAAYKFTDRQKDGCGYDLEFVNRDTGVKVCVEVKGTDQSEPHFIISSNEFLTGKRMSKAAKGAGERWTLAVVCNALSSPRIAFHGFNEMCEEFELRELAWHATKRRKRKN